MPQLPILRPLGKVDLAQQHWLDPVDGLPLACRQAASLRPREDGFPG